MNFKPFTQRVYNFLNVNSGYVIFYIFNRFLFPILISKTLINFTRSNSVNYQIVKDNFRFVHVKKPHEKCLYCPSIEIYHDTGTLYQYDAFQTNQLKKKIKNQTQDQQELLLKSARLNKDQRPFTSALSFPSVHQTSVLFDIYYFFK